MNEEEVLNDPLADDYLAAENIDRLEALAVEAPKPKRKYTRRKKKPEPEPNEYYAAPPPTLEPEEETGTADPNPKNVSADTSKLERELHKYEQYWRTFEERLKNLKVVRKKFRPATAHIADVIEANRAIEAAFSEQHTRKFLFGTFTGGVEVVENLSVRFPKLVGGYQLVGDLTPSTVIKSDDYRTDWEEMIDEFAIKWGLMKGMPVEARMAFSLNELFKAVDAHNRSQAAGAKTTLVTEEKGKEYADL